MVIYEVYYRDMLIGRLYISEGRHRYVPNAENAERIAREVPIRPELIRGTEWGPPIPFFEQRILNHRRFGREKLISEHTNHYVMKMITEDLC